MSKNVTPIGRISFGLCYGYKKIYVFGGAKTIDGNGYEFLNDLWCYTFRGVFYGEWNECKCIDNIIPDKRYGCELNYYNNNLYLYGGYNGKNTIYYNDIWLYNINKTKWDIINTKYKPPKSEKHKTCIFACYIILFGGAMKNELTGNVTGINDIYIFNLITYKWSKIKCKNKPKKRFNHGMCVVGDTLLIHGGQSLNKQILNDICYINLNDLINNNKPIWHKININSPRITGHILMGYNINNIYLFGGMSNNKIPSNKLSLFSSLNINNHTKREYFNTSFIDGYIRYITSKYNINIPRDIYNILQRFLGPTTHFIELNDINGISFHNGCLINIDNEPYIFIFGGATKQNCSDITYIIHTNVVFKSIDYIETHYNKICKCYTITVGKGKIGIVHENWVFKQNNDGKWQKRYMVLRNDKLFFFKTDKDKKKLSRCIEKIELKQYKYIKSYTINSNIFNEYKIITKSEYASDVTFKMKRDIGNKWLNYIQLMIND